MPTIPTASPRLNISPPGSRARSSCSPRPASSGRRCRGSLDPAISAEDQHEIAKLIAEYSKRYGVSFHALRTRQAGARQFVSFHLLVPDAWTVAQAHQLSEEIEARMRSMVPNAAIFTHIEPISDPASYEDQGLDR